MKHLKVAGKHRFIYCFGVKVDKNKKEQKLEQSSVVDKEHLIGIAVRRKGSTGISSNNNPIVSDTTFDASFLTLKQRSVEIVEKLPLAIIESFTKDGKWFDVDIPNVDMAQSSVLTANESLITDGEEFEFTFLFLKSVIRKK